MALAEIQDVRERLNRFLIRSGHGAINLMADRARLSRQRIRQFRDGESVRYDTLKRIADALDQCESANVPKPVPAYPTPEEFVLKACAKCGYETHLWCKGRKQLFCGNCGSKLGIECPSCSWVTVEKDSGPIWCDNCRTPLNDEARRIRDCLDAANEPAHVRITREDREKRQRAADRKKRGEPEM